VVATHILADIDQVCTHVGVLHEGRMIFCGSMTEMKRRLRGDSFFLELGASEDARQRLQTLLLDLEGITLQWLDGHRLRVTISQEKSRAAGLAEVLRRVDQAGAVLQSIQSGLGATEDAYLQLLQEDELHGFKRFQDAPRPTDPRSGAHLA